MILFLQWLLLFVLSVPLLSVRSDDEEGNEDEDEDKANKDKANKEEYAGQGCTRLADSQTLAAGKPHRSSAYPTVTATVAVSVVCLQRHSHLRLPARSPRTPPLPVHRCT